MMNPKLTFYPNNLFGERDQHMSLNKRTADIITTTKQIVNINKNELCELIITKFFHKMSSL